MTGPSDGTCLSMTCQSMSSVARSAAGCRYCGSDRYGAQPLQAAVIEALARDVPHPNAVRLALERAREQLQQLPPVATQLSERARSLDVTVRHHGLDAYDALRPDTGATPTEDQS